MLLGRLTLALVIAVLVLGHYWSGPASIEASQTADEQCFPETNRCIRGAFLRYWREHGGLAINGYPLTEPFSQTFEYGASYTVQYFERVRLEAHPEQEAPYDVLLGHFGRLLYLTDPAYPPRAALIPDATYYDATGHNLTRQFRAYWHAHGGLAQFGYPISEEIEERLEDGTTHTVQYFERARFELHPENAPPYDVLLGQFGRRIVEVMDPNAPLPYVVSGNRGATYRNQADIRARLARPTGAEYPSDGVIQPFERGAMIWRKDQRKIYVVAKDQGTYQPLGQWRVYDDTWEDSQPAGGGPAPVPDLFLPQRGFGKIWREIPEVQHLLGYAVTADEAEKRLVLQDFVGGLIVDVREAPGSQDYRNSPGSYLLYTNQRFEFRYSFEPWPSAATGWAAP